MYRIRCHTLFDITQTGILNRSKPNEDNVQEWILKRNTQCNFDTILQVISLRSQPDQVSVPNKVEMEDSDLNRFGFLFMKNELFPAYCWNFDFEVHHSSVFENGITPYGALYKDCEGVPMINCPTQMNGVTSFLDITSELQNIYFEAL
jgi:hypothetical protein